MFCEKCGKEIQPGARFCTGCGAQAQVIPNEVLMPQNVQQSISKPTQSNTYQQPKKKKSFPIIIAIVGVVLIIGGCITGVILANHNQNNNEDNDKWAYEDTESIPTTEKVEEKEEADITEVREDTEVENTEVSTTEAIVIPSELSLEECEAIVAEFSERSAVDTSSKSILFEMADLLINTKICTSQGMILSQMSDEDMLIYDYSLIRNAYEDNLLSSAVQSDFGIEIDYDEVLELVQDTYLASRIPDSDFAGLFYKDEDTLQLAFADGEPWMFSCGGQIKENENYYLLSAPCRYGSNGEMSERIEGYIDILFVKNKESQFGVSILYARTYEKSYEIASVEVSSELESGYGKTYTASNLIDGDFATAWVEGVSGIGVGETITIHLDKPTEIYGVEIYNGYLASLDLFAKNGKVTEVSIDFGNGQRINGRDVLYFDELYYEGDYCIDQIGLDTPIVTDTIIITINGAVSGLKYDDTCISEIKLY